jgi:hypothetical protein
MTSRRFWIAAVALSVAASDATAGIFSRKPKANPVERVPELVSQLKSSNDESLRSSAAEELREYDPKSHPEILPTLIGVLNQDTSASVRAEAAASLGKLRPISQQAGYALEQAQVNDGSIRVRLAARQALFQYHFVGYRGGKPDDNKDSMQTVSGQSPPTGLPGLVKSPQTPTRTIMTPQGPFRETAEPPLADPPVIVKRKTPATAVARPKGEAPAQLVPAQPPKLAPLPDGPSLPPPK